LSLRQTWNHKSGQGDHHNREILKNSRVASELDGYGNQTKQKNEGAQKNELHPLMVSVSTLLCQ
jgi:hypothetical protein